MASGSTAMLRRAAQNCSRQASAEHFQQCAEFLLLRDCGLGPFAVAVLPIRLPASWSILCRLKKLQQILPRTCQGFLNPLLSTTAFFVCCGVRRRFSICADVTLRRFGIPRGWKSPSANGPCGT
jgi:hypothetical protein